MINESHSRIITRTGSEPKIRCCIFDTREKKTSFLDPKYNTIILSGKGKQHIQLKESIEINPFRRKVMKNFPNSNRTLIPQNETPSPLSFNHSFSIQNKQLRGLFNPNLKNTLINYQEPTIGKRRQTNNAYRAKDILMITSEISKVETEYKRCKKPGEYNHYTSLKETKQSFKESEIKSNDLNQNTLQYRRNTAFCSKISNEYCSKVACLPGRFTKNTDEYCIKNGKKIHVNKKTDIFNEYSSSTINCKAFCRSKKKVLTQEKNNEREFTYEMSRKGKVNVKVNLFKSQIEIY